MVWFGVSVREIYPGARSASSMVAPHPAWSDTDDGYRRGDVGVYVQPALLETSPGSSFHRSGGVSETDANAYSVEVRTGLETAGETWDVIAHFADARTAWEFTNLLTYYFEAEVDARFAKSNLLHSDPDYPGDEQELPDLVKDLGAGEALQRLLHPRPLPNAVENALEQA